MILILNSIKRNRILRKREVIILYSSKSIVIYSGQQVCFETRNKRQIVLRRKCPQRREGSGPSHVEKDGKMGPEGERTGGGGRMKLFKSVQACHVEGGFGFPAMWPMTGSSKTNFLMATLWLALVGFACMISASFLPVTEPTPCSGNSRPPTLGPCGLFSRCLYPFMQVILCLWLTIIRIF